MEDNKKVTDRLNSLMLHNCLNLYHITTFSLHIPKFLQNQSKGDFSIHKIKIMRFDGYTHKNKGPVSLTWSSQICWALCLDFFVPFHFQFKILYKLA